MNIFENLTPNKRKFLESLGIKSDEDMPKSFFEPIMQCRECLLSAEYFYAGDYTVSGNYYIPFCIKDLVGTDHDRYAGKTWIGAFADLDRGEELLEYYFSNPDYYDVILRSNQKYFEHSSSIGVIEKNNKYYLCSRAGGGNNRMIIMKIRYLAMSKNKSAEEMEEIDSLHTFYANTRIIPDNPEVVKIVEELLWTHYKKDYYLENISTDYHVRIFNITHGNFNDREVIWGPLTEEEFVAKASELVRGFSYSQGETTYR